MHSARSSPPGKTLEYPTFIEYLTRTRHGKTLTYFTGRYREAVILGWIQYTPFSKIQTLIERFVPVNIFHFESTGCFEV